MSPVSMAEQQFYAGLCNCKITISPVCSDFDSPPSICKCTGFIDNVLVSALCSRGGGAGNKQITEGRVHTSTNTMRYNSKSSSHLRPTPGRAGSSKRLARTLLCATHHLSDNLIAYGSGLYASINGGIRSDMHVWHVCVS